MRRITTHAINPCNEALLVEAIDGPGSGGASHHYEIGLKRQSGIPEVDSNQLCVLLFQNGPVFENGNGVNGITHEALLAILIDRLQGFQSGQYKTRENAIALTHLEEALMWLHKRTRDREARGVEGTHQP